MQGGLTKAYPHNPTTQKETMFIIKTYTPISSCRQIFQFHYVAIEPGLLASGFRSLPRFPFHYGSIETNLLRANLNSSK